MTIIDTDSAFGVRAAKRLRDDAVGWLTTVGAKSRTPAPNLVWFLWRDDALLIFSQRDRSKLANIAEHPRVSFHFDSERHGNHAVILAGVAHIVHEGVAGLTDDEVAAFSAKYGDDMRRIGYSPDQFYAEYAVPIRVVPDRLRGF